MNDLKITRRKLADYKPAVVNPNRHTPKGLQVIEDSVSYAGAGRSGLADKHGEMIAGSGTLEAMARAGIDEVIEVEVDGHQWVVVKRADLDINDPKARSLQIADNRATVTGFDEDTELVAALLADIAVQDKALVQAAGYDQWEVDALLVEIDTLAAESLIETRERGQTAQERLGGFLDATIKQIVLYFANDEYDSIVNRLADLRTQHGFDNNSELFVMLLEYYENHTS